MRRPVVAALVAAGVGLPTLVSSASAAAAVTSQPQPVSASPAPPNVTAPTGFEEPSGGPPALGPPRAKAWIVVDADTGAVIGAAGEHVPLRPASVVKVLTALVAVEALPPSAVVPVGPDAAGEEAAKINMQAGQVWPFSDALHSLLIVSANDAAEAVADRVSGSPTAFGQLEERVMTALGAADHPILNDPAGLDDSFANGGGDYISAYDLAIASRAAMTIPDIRDTVGVRTYPFLGPDGVHHTLRNHNLLLGTDPTSIGVKDGYTAQAGSTYIGMVTRGGRTMLAVELGVTDPNIYDAAEYLFTLGFATPVAAESPVERLPAVRIPDVAAMAASPDSTVGGGETPASNTSGAGKGAATGPRVVGTGVSASASRSSEGTTKPVALIAYALVALAVVAFGVQRRRVTLRRRRRRADRLVAGYALLAAQEAQRGVDRPEILGGGEMVDAWQGDQAGVG